MFNNLLGGSYTDISNAISVDSAGDVLVTGVTGSPWWVSGGFDTSYDGGWDAFVAKLSSAGAHVWSTYLGGSSDEYGTDITVDSVANVLVTGDTRSSGWVNGGFDTSYDGGGDAFVAKLSPSGAHLWSTYLGGTNFEAGDDIAVDGAGNVLVTGDTQSSSWVNGGFDTSYDGVQDAFVAKIRDGPAQNTAALQGSVLGVDSLGRAQGPLAGATVQLAAVESTTTDAQGNFQFSTVTPGSSSVTVSKAGYYSVTRTVNFQSGETKNETFQLAPQSGAAGPSAYDFASPNGRHFIPGMPGNLTFSTTVAWNGSQGSVRFLIDGTWHTAAITDLGGGQARASLTIAAPSAISVCSELMIEVSNGSGQQRSVRSGVHFSPIPGIIIPWYRDNIPWNLSGVTMAYAADTSLLQGLSLGGPEAPFSFKFYRGEQRRLAYDVLAGTFRGSFGGFGTFGFGVSDPISGWEVLGEGRLDQSGTLMIDLAGCDSPRITPGWEISVTAKAGVGAPLVNAVDVCFQPAAPFVHGLQRVPVLGGVVNAAKLRMFIVGGLRFSGQYAGGQPPDCFLGTTAIDVAGTLGVEAQALLDYEGLAGVGVYVAGSGTPEVRLCPEWEWRAITFRVNCGVFAFAPLFYTKADFGTEFRFDSGAQAQGLWIPTVLGEAREVAWQPSGNQILDWGEPNRPVDVRALGEGTAGGRIAGDISVQTLLHNVTQLGSPSVVADSKETMVLFTLHDALKPWYAATDIGTMRQTNDGPWALGRIVDDLSAEFTPSIVLVDSNTFLSAWTRVSGDLSSATNPAQVFPHLEIVASWFNRSAGTWSVPTQLTTNSLVDRAPLPVIFGTVKGLLWVQNAADAAIGTSTNGDRLLFARWTGTGWDVPQTVWDAPKGILQFEFAADSAGQGHVVFAVDEDGGLDTRTDRELYRGSTVAGVWQAAVRLMTDGVEDSLPVLVAPNGTPTCVWSASNTLAYSSLNAWNPKPVFSEYTLANQAPTLGGITMPGGAAVAYAVQGSNGVDMVASFYDAALDRWSLPRQLTEDDHAESALALAHDGTNVVIAYLNTQTLRTNVDMVIGGQTNHLVNVPQPGRTDLCLLRYSLGNDLAVVPGSLFLNPINRLLK